MKNIFFVFLGVWLFLFGNIFVSCSNETETVTIVEKPVEVIKYVCPKDNKEYTTAEEASKCCGVQYETVRKYVCPKDGKEYDTAEEAANCCGPIEVEKLVYTSELAAGTYAVYHLQQKTTGGKAVSDYVLESTENSKTVAAESTIANLRKTYIGFTEKAMAQNETAIYIFYDRNTITYTFQTGTEGKFEDGKTEKTVSGLYGASYTKPKAPTSGDYNFVKWQDSSENAAPSAFGAEDKTWTAVWRLKSAGGETIPEDFVLIPAGTFQMGSNQGYSNNKPVHTVTISNAFYMCDHEVTQAEYEAVMGEGSNPSYFKTGAAEGEVQENRPVETVSWYMAIVYCNKRSIKEGLTPCYTISEKTDPAEWGSSDATWNAVECNWTANGYRLPTEAEWEYAARAGDNTVDALTWSGTNASASLGDYAWYSLNAGSETHEVKKKSENAYKLYDMSGNVWEWCWDWWPAKNDYSEAATTDPSGDTSGSRRVLRGGYSGDSGNCAVSSRIGLNPNYQDCYFGFRVCRSSSN